MIGIKILEILVESVFESSLNTVSTEFPGPTSPKSIRTLLFPDGGKARYDSIVIFIGINLKKNGIDE